MVNRVHMSNIIGAFVHITRDFAIMARPVSADTTSISTYGFNLVDIRWGEEQGASAAAAFEQKQGHIAVFPVIGVEQRKLLRAVCVGIRIVGIFEAGHGLKFKQCRECLVICWV